MADQQRDPRYPHPKPAQAEPVKPAQAQPVHPPPQQQEPYANQQQYPQQYPQQQYPDQHQNPYDYNQQNYPNQYQQNYPNQYQQPHQQPYQQPHQQPYQQPYDPNQQQYYQPPPHQQPFQQPYQQPYEEEQRKGFDLESVSLNFEPNLAAALSYLLLIVSGIGFLIIERKSDFVKFHAMQSILFTAAWILVYVGWTIVWLVFGIFSAMAGFGLPLAIVGKLANLIFIGFFIVWIMLMARAYKGDRWKLPFIGDIAEKQLKNQFPQN